MKSQNDIAQHAVAAFERDGFLILRNVLGDKECSALREVISQSLQPLVGPAEYEADVGYPGSPADRDAPGGTTPRRLLHAYARSGLLRELAKHSVVGAQLAALMNCVPLVSQCHHNCVMTKHPGFSSSTLWHQDIRYWSFDKPELITAWFALQNEHEDNGALRIIPGTHRLNLDRGQLDRDLFLRPELPENASLIDQAIPVALNAGDVLLFHCRLFHAAGRNLTGQVKLSPVFTYHAPDNQPIPGTRSASIPGISIA